ncbi:MAG: hypothetical protein FD171_2143 [Actinobacteria bacterium]|nr:MAG: hypothetical protein FD171_2143 [Actinomycetota bacterium]
MGDIVVREDGVADTVIYADFASWSTRSESDTMYEREDWESQAV